VEKFLGLNVGFELWKKQKDKPTNITTNTKGQVPYDKWSQKMKDSFWQICGKQMRQAGYS
jgi:hypothetical protein